MKKILLTLLTFLAFSGMLEAQKAKLAWSPVTTYADGTTITGQTLKYDVWRAEKQDLTDAARIAFDVTVITHTDGTLQIGKLYYYYVRAYINATNPSVNSNVQTFILLPAPAAPGGLTIAISP